MKIIQLGKTALLRFEFPLFCADRVALNNVCTIFSLVEQIIQKVQQIATDWTIRGSNPGGDGISRTCPDRPWGPTSLLYSGNRLSLSGVKRPGRGLEHQPLCSAEVKERVDLRLYSPSGPSWCFVGGTLHFHLYRKFQQPFVYKISLLETKRYLLYIRNQSVPRCKHFPPRS